MKKSKSLLEALKELPLSKEWFKFTEEEKLEFKKMMLSEEQSKKASFVLGGTLKRGKNEN